MVKVLLVTSSYLPRIGGLQSVTSSLATELQRRGHTVKIVTQQYPRSLPARERTGGIRVRRLRFLWPTLQSLRDERLDLWLEGLFYFPVSLVSLLKILLREKPQVVNLHFLGVPAPFLLAAKSILNFSYVISLHGDDVQGYARGTRFDKWLFRASLRRAGAVTACSHSLLAEAKAIEPGIARKARVIYNGTRVEGSGVGGQGSEVMGRGGHAHQIVAVGRMVPKKGFDLLLKALPEVLRQNACTQLLLIGDGPERSALEKLAKSLHLDNSVQFLGERTHEAAMRIMSEASLVAIPSREEPFGLVALEAMFLGKPVVATEVGGLPEVLNGADALLVSPDDAGALANSIIAMINKEEIDPTFGAHNRRIAERFSMAAMTDKYLSLYQSLCVPDLTVDGGRTTEKT